MRQYLVVSAVGQDRPGIVDRISEFILDHDCNIEDSRMAILGGEFA
ncbi:MAG: glycine cleavage system protein R, partial [Verrucomicrobia bacterium]|nr:glycine cleavage system protein R [Verrucomicrobiota bacterium]